MKIDIKSIVNTLASGVSEIKNTGGTVNIREALGEANLDAENGEERDGFPKETEQGQVEAVKEVEELQSQPEAAEDESESEILAEPENSEAEQSEAVAAIEGEAPEEEESEEEEPEEDSEATEEAPEGSETAAEEIEEEEPEEVAAVDEGEIVSEEVSEEEHAEPEKIEEDEKPEESEDDKPKELSPDKEKILTWGGKYGWLTGIAASFLILIAFMVIYTTMTPREITATIDGQKRTFVTEEYTIEGFLAEERISICEEDYLSLPLTTFIQEGITFELEHATNFVVTADGKIKKYKSLNDTVQQALDDIGIEVGEIDIVKPAPDVLLEENMHVIVQRVEIKEEVREEKVAFKTVEKDDVTMNEGTTKTVTKGKDGKDKVTYKVKYIDGKEVSKKEVDRETISAAVDEVIAHGTRVNYNGKSYSRKLTVKAYSYTGGGTTAMGTRARVGEIAVDPSVIPLGTNVYIEGVGPRRAEDTGGNIKGNTIDIYMNTRGECIRWGVRYVTIYIE